ncbi:MAG: cytochrome c maturation protein CcmE [Gammaproteobacteria bacterium]|jgi:cytochrome c-type biogenesis protein CcmE
MTPKRKKRLILIGLMVAGVAVAVTMALKAFNENLMFFFSPVEVAAGKAPGNAPFRLGGMVVDGSVNRPGDGILVEFGVTDYADTVKVRYEGILPDLFREGQGIVALGRLDEQGVFVADEVLAKHDENYMPPEVADAIKTAQTQNND